MLVVYVLYVKCEKSFQALMFDAAVETLPQGFIQQQHLNWLSIVCARKLVCPVCQSQC